MKIMNNFPCLKRKYLQVILKMSLLFSRKKKKLMYNHTEEPEDEYNNLKLNCSREQIYSKEKKTILFDKELNTKINEVIYYFLFFVL